MYKNVYSDCATVYALFNVICTYVFVHENCARQIFVCPKSIPENGI